MAAKLTKKQSMFIEEYLVDLNATQAAIRAGYSRDTARSQGQRMLTKVDIKEAIQKAIDDRSKRVEVTADRVLQELAKIGFADIKDYMSFRTTKTIVDHSEDGGPVVDYGHVVELKDSDQVDGAPIAEVQLKDGTLKFKLHDKVKALEGCARHLGMFVDKTEITGKDGGPIKMKLEDFFNPGTQD